MTNFNINVIVNPTAAVVGTKAVRSELRKTEAAGGRLNKVLKGVFAFAGLGLGINQLRKFGDSFIELQNRLRVAGFETEQLAGATAKLIEVSNRTRSPLDANAKLLGRIGIAANDLGASQTDMFRVIELVGKGLAIQGSSAQEARGAIIQLSQAFGSGTVRAEEFNSVAEGAAPILQAVAKSMGTTFSGLKKLVAAGKVASKDFFQALLDGGADLDALFAQVSPTIGQALTVLNNQFIALTGTLETQFGGVLSGVANAILFLANNLTVIVPLMLDFAGAVLAVKLAIFTQSLFTAGAAVVNFTSGLRVALRVVPGLTGALRILNAVLRVNPFFLIASAIGLVITLLLQFGSAVKLTSDGSVTLATAMQAVLNIFLFLGGAVLEGIIFGFQVLGEILSVLGKGLLIIAGQIFDFFAPLGPMFAVLLATATAATLAFLGLASPLLVIAGVIATVVVAATSFKDEIIAIFPPAKLFFDFMIKALEIAVQIWDELAGAVSTTAKKLGLFEGNVKKTSSALKDAGNAAGGFGEQAKGAAKKANDSHAKVGSNIKNLWADTANSASSSLNTFANNGVGSANRVKSAMNSAAAAARSVGSGGGGGGGSSGGGITPLGGTRATFSVPQILKDVAKALGGSVQQSTARTVSGGLQIKRSIVGGTGFADEIATALTKASSVTAGTTVLTPEVQSIISQLAQVSSDLKVKENLAALNLSDAQRKALGTVSGAGAAVGGIGGRNGNTEAALAVQADKLQKQLTALLTPPSESLEKAAVSLEKASVSLTTAADAPIWLQGNPFEAFRQNVFGFAKGGQFSVGGSGGADSKLMNLALTPGEQVSVKTPAQMKRDEEGGGNTFVTQNIEYNVQTPDVDGFRRSQTQIVGKTLSALASVERRL